MKKKTILKFQSVICKLVLAIFLSVCIVFSICVHYSFAEVPCKINYQGRLIENNVPVDGTKTMVFSIYNETNNLLWTSEEVDITVYNGLFRYVLGSDVEDLSSIPWTAGETLYLEVKVEDDILKPREAIYAYPYAINSHLLEGATKEYFINTSGETQTKRGNLKIEGILDINAPDTDIDALRVHSGDTYGLYVSTGGNVGIGTTSPGAKLEVADGELKVTNGGNDYVALGVPGMPGKKRGRIKLWDEGVAEHTVYITADGDSYINSGNVGIGTTSPQRKLHVIADKNPVILEGNASTEDARSLLNSLPNETLLIGGPWGNQIYFYWKDENGNKYFATLTGAGL